MAQAILLKDVENVGERGDVVDVSPGYLRNFLLPRKLAFSATPASLLKAAVLMVSVKSAAATALTGMPTVGNTKKNSSIPDNNIFAMHVDRRGRVWIGTWREGLVLFDKATKSFTTYPIGKAGPTQSEIWATA